MTAIVFDIRQVARDSAPAAAADGGPEINVFFASV